MREITINGVTYSDQSLPYIIAEVGHNHQGNIETALEMIRAAAESGASAVKFQKRNNRKLFTKEGFDAPYLHENSFGKTYGEHREALEFNKEEYELCISEAKKLHVDFFATAFDFDSTDFLMELDVPAFKVASGDLKSIQLIEYIAKTGKPMIISTGGGEMNHIRATLDVATRHNPNVAILQCTAGYPPAYEELNLRVIDTLRKEFPEVTVGYSGHDSGIAMSLVAYVLGARVIEKHFTLNRAMKGTDHAFSLEPLGFSKMVRDIKRTSLALGDGVKKVYESEKSPLIKMGKSIYFAKNLTAGSTLTYEDLVFKSPARGKAPYEIDQVIGKKLKENVVEDQVVTDDLFD